ncbi:MAG: Holliday junction resolvase RuvX [Gammaproteobacteria bacterium]|nr:Holliday junction resolvase RuvX [Gammaproteobacteria bacterium]|tara:strand:+ start:2552 stop:2986 length:435 start_codon:yes stop_codon:yes gene_type:complete
MPEVSKPRTVLAFDFGARRIGVAIGQDITGTGTPLGIINNYNGLIDHDAIEAILKEWQPTIIVVGIPRHTDGSISKMQKEVESFIKELQRYKLNIQTVDERYTSIEAKNVLKLARISGTRGRISKEMIDSAAAVLIAERYLSSN